MRLLRIGLFFGLPSIFSLLLWYWAKLTLPPASSFFQIVTQLCALLGLIFLSLSLLLSTKMLWLDKYFRGSDKVYFIHHLIGGIGFLLILVHPLLLVASVWPLFKLAILFFIPGTYIPMAFGIVSIYVFILCFITMFFIKLPFAKWLGFHRLLVVAYILGSIHAFLAHSDIRSFFPLYIFMLIIVVIGVFSGLYIIFFYSSLGRKYLYQVQEIRMLEDTVNVSMVPLGGRMRFQAGQYVYIKFHNPVIGMEMHPFSISSAHDEETLRITVKSLGDYTNGLKYAQPGDQVEVYGPYGVFGDIYEQGAQKLIWVGGGVGVTPFLSMLHQEAIHPKSGKIHFFYSYQKVSEGIFTKEITALLKYTPRVTFYDWCADESGFITVKDMVAKMGEDITGYSVLLCGPPGMMHALQTQLLQAGVPKSSIIFENFSFAN